MYYKHSGRFTLGGIALGLLTGCAGGFVLAYAYGMGLKLIPEVHLAFFATIIFGLAAGAAAGYGLVRGHVRNTQVALLVSWVTTAFSLYMSWAIWFQSVLHRGNDMRYHWSVLAQHPIIIWRLMKWINQYGTWTIDSGSPTTGWMLWGIWYAEAGIILSMGMVAAWGLVQKHPYCEACGQWCRRAASLVFAPVQDTQQLKLQAESKDLHALESLGPAARTADHLLVSLESCDRCGQLHTLSIAQTRFQRQKFGGSRVSATQIVQHLIVGPAEAQKIAQLKEMLANSPKPARKAQAAAGR